MIILDLGPAPAKPLSINEERTIHWANRHRRLHPWRDLTCILAIDTQLRQALNNAPCSVTVHIPVPDNRRRDPANYYPVAKSCIDGLVMARVWPDDDPRYVTVNEPVLWREAHAEIRLELRERP